MRSSIVWGKKEKTQDLHSKGNVANAAKNTKKTRSMATPEPQPQLSSDANSDQVSTKKPVVVIAGGLLIKNVQGWRISKGTKVKTVVKAWQDFRITPYINYAFSLC